MSSALNWKEEIVKLVYIKQVLADADKKHLYPHHLPKVGATLGQIRACELALGFELQQDHIELLLHANGWDGFVQSTDLFGTVDFLGSNRFIAANQLLNSYEKGVFEGIGKQRETLFPIAASPLDGDIFAMVNPNIHSKSSQVFWFAGYEIDSYLSFSEFFLAMMDYNRLGISKLWKA